MKKPKTYILLHLSSAILLILGCGGGDDSTQGGKKLIIGDTLINRDGNKTLDFDFDGDGGADFSIDCQLPENELACEAIRNGEELPDSDGDQVWDFFEGLLGTDPLAVDSDGDGLADGDELLWNADPLNPDTDGDTLSDGDEVNVEGTDPTEADSDGDGVNDNQDQCQNTASGESVGYDGCGSGDDPFDEFDICDRKPWICDGGM